MKDPRLARRYARALYSVANERSVADRVDGELRRFVDLIRENRKLSDFLATPRVAANEKERVLRSILEGLVHKALEEFLILLRRKGRFALVDEIATEYRKILDEAQQLATARVTSAVPLQDDERQRLKAVLESKTGKSVTLEEIVDASVIAGASVIIGGQIIDDTVRHHLDELRIRFHPQGRAKEGRQVVSVRHVAGTKLLHRADLRSIPVHLAAEGVS